MNSKRDGGGGGYTTFRVLSGSERRWREVKLLQREEGSVSSRMRYPVRGSHGSDQWVSPVTI